jgi:hypothetical protein
MEISYSSNCLSPSSSLASQFSHSIAFSPISDDLTSRISRHVFLPNQSTISNLPTTNLILSLSSTSNRFEYYHSQQRRDQQTIVATTANTSTSNTPTSTHVLCR